MAVESEEQTVSRSPARRLLRVVGLAVLGIVALVAVFLGLLDTGPGKRIVADRIAALEFENGMQIEVGRIEGSLYGRMIVRDLSVKDPKGEFLYSPVVRVDWRPFAYLWSHIDIRSATAERMILRRVPEFREVPDTGEPLLPDLDIDVGKLKIARLIAEKPVTGERQIATVSGKAHIASGRAQVWLDGRTLKSGGNSGGDFVKLVLDAVPEAERLALQIDVKAPQGGVIAALAGFTEPVAINAKGSGDWKKWDGNLDATYGSKPMARLALAARDGTVSAKGPLQLAGFLTGPTANLLSPVSQLDLEAVLGERSAVVAGNLTSDAMRLNANGNVDLSDNTFDGLKLAFVLLRPSALAENLSGSGMRAMLTLDGAFSAPRVAYTINASRIAMNDMGLEQFAAKGNARVDPDRILIPVSATARRITGLDTVAGGSLANVRLDGDIAVQGARMLSDNMRVRSDRIDARSTLLANLETGLYAGAINGRIDDYRLESVGIFNVETDVDLESDRRGFALAGKVRARSTKLLNASVREYLGGNFVASSDVRYGGDGVVRFANLRLEAPDLRVTGGGGSYSPDGRIALTADGVSDRYGRLGVRVAGTLDNPDARVTADRPDLGIGLANLEARITGARNGYRLDLTGDTDYGPLSADVTLGTRGAMRIEIERANLSNVDFTGSLTQTRSGPFAGTLRASGNGLGGVVTLAAAGRYQQADFHLRSTGTRFDGPARFRIGSAIVDGRAVLYDRPEVVANVQIARSRYGSFFINALRADIDYRGGRGRAKALLEGRSEVPFRVALNAQMEPKLWRVALDGKARGIAFKTLSPARIVPGRGTYELLPTTIGAGGGTIRLAGDYGRGLKLQSRMEGVDIALLNAFMPGSGLGGKASGSIDFAQASPSAFPRADARLHLDNFTRTSAAVVSQPVDVNFVGKLLADGGEARAVFRLRGSVIGRMVASLRPLGPGGGDWTTRLLAAPLGGGIRYNGPAEALFSLAGQPGQSLSGSLGLAADFGCRVSDPCLSGVVRGKGLTYENQQYGTRLTKMDLVGRFDGDHLNIEDLKASAGNGTLQASGTVGLAAAAGYPMDIAIALERARLARSDALSASATGKLRLTKVAGQSALLSGEVRLPETRYKIVREGAAAVPRLSGVTFKPRRRRERITGDEPAEPIASIFDSLRLDIDVTAPEKLYVSGMGLESEWSARFTVGGTSTAPTMLGNVRLIRGTLGFAGRSFELEEGVIDFTGGRELDPRLRLVASEDVEDVLVRVNVGGRATNPEIAFNSVPGLPQDEIMSRILFGSSIANLSAIQAVQLASSLNALRASGGGLNPLGKLRSAAGIDRLRILGEDEKTGRGTALAAGQYITDDVYIELITDARGFTATQLEVAITPWLSVLSEASGSGLSSVNVRVRKNY
ncbi:MAG: translocation/assembly module TamB domain-containing protein [Novosphingobium sp.]|nr:translocation/assembly module TamB domain-containing protein [Novosphingobium sp.]